ANSSIRIERSIDPQVLGLRVALDEQRPGTMPLNRAYHFPGIFLVLLRISANYGDGVVTQVAGCPDRSKFRINEVCTTARMRNLARFDRGCRFALLEIDKRDLVGGVGGIHEITVSGVQATVMQEAWRVDYRGLQVVQVGVVDHHHLTGL